MTGDAVKHDESASRGVRRLTTSLTTRSFMRAFTIQGSWNYRNMMGNGFAFALLPILREIYRGRELDMAVGRHAERFNAHPYLANLVLGAVARMEAEGRDADEVRRFKQALSGPLGGLGDTLIWATLLPTVMLLALTLAWVGAPAWVAVATFLVLYNAGHLALRVWGFRTGLREGREVGRELRTARLGARAEDLARIGSFILGVLVGLVLLNDPGLGGPRWAGAGLGLAAIALGLLGGQRVWRPAALVVVGLVIAVSATRFFL